MQSGQLFKCATLLGGTELFKRLLEVFPRVALGYEVHLAILVVSVDALAGKLLSCFELGRYIISLVVLSLCQLLHRS